MKRERSNLALDRRIDAVVALVSMADHIVRDAQAREAEARSVPWRLVARLKRAHVDRSTLRKDLDAILAITFGERPWLAGFVACDVADFEEALGIEHDPRSAAARAEYVARLGADSSSAQGAAP